MSNLFFMEWKKRFCGWKLLVLLLLPVFIIVWLTFRPISGTLKTVPMSISFYEDTIQSGKRRLAEMEQDEKTPRDSKFIEYFERVNQENKNMLEALKSKDTQKMLAAQLAMANTAVYARQKNLSDSSYKSIKELKDEAAFLQYLADNQIHVAPGNVSQLNGLYMVYMFIRDIYPFLLPVMILLMVFGTVTKERTQGTLKFLLQQPYRRSNVLFSKLLSSGAVTAIILFLINLAQVLTCTIATQTGDGRYPIATSELTFNSFLIGETSYLAISDFLIFSSLLTIVAILFYTALGLLISVISPNTFVSFILCAFSVSFPFILKFGGIEMPLWISNIASIVTGEYPFYGIAAFYLLVSAGLVFLSTCIFKRQNVYQ